MQGLRIAFFVWEFYPRLVGGLGTYAIEMTRQFVQTGHDVVVFTLNPGDLVTHEIWNGVLIHRPEIVDLSSVFPGFVTDDLKHWGTNLKMFCDIFSYQHLSASKLINELIRKEKERYDVVAVNDWLAAISGLIVKKEISELPVVFHVHSTEQQRSRGEGSEAIKYFELNMAERANKVITVSHSMQDHLISIGYPSTKIRPIWNGCDPEKYNPAIVKEDDVNTLKKKYGLESHEQVILFIGRLTWVKGVQNLIQAMPFVLSRFPFTKLVILGKGGDYDNLTHLAKRLGIERQVIFRSEFVSEKERILHYAMADLCVFPSLSEPFGIVSLEAMSMEKPVVVGARGVNGFKEQVVPVGDDQNGFHVNGEEPSDIAWGINEVLGNPEKVPFWGKNGRRRVLQYFTWEKAAENTLSVYKEAIEKG